MTEYVISQPYCNTRMLSSSYIAAASEIEITYAPGGDSDDAPGFHVAVPTNSRNEPLLRIPVTIARPQP
jgi:hypothetical protein